MAPETGAQAEFLTVYFCTNGVGTLPLTVSHVREPAQIHLELRHGRAVHDRLHVESGHSWALWPTASDPAGALLRCRYGGGDVNGRRLLGASLPTVVPPESSFTG